MLEHKKTLSDRGGSSIRRLRRRMLDSTKTWARLLFVVLLAGAPQRSSASMFGEENIALGAILTEAIQQTIKLQETVKFVKDTSAFARDTARFTKQSIQVAQNVRNLVHHPGNFSAYAKQSWRSAFPDLAEVAENVAMVRQAMKPVSGADGLSTYDPHALVQVFDQLGQLRGSGYEVMAHAMDLWGVNDPHDEAIGVLHELHQESADNLDNMNHAIAGEGMTVREAAVHGARAQALTAEAQIRMATTVERLSRTVEMQAMRAMAREAQGASQDFLQRQDATQPHVRSWQLDPLETSPSERRSR